MSDSDDSKPVQRKPQPKPRPRRAVSKVTSDSPGSLKGQSDVTSPNKGITTSPSQTKRRNQDDFFNKAKYYRDVVKVQENMFRDETEAEAEENIPASDSVLVLDDTRLSDLEDEAKQKKTQEKPAKAPEPELKRKREISLTPPPELPVRQYPCMDPLYIRPTTSIELIDLGDDNDRANDDLDPELASIAAQITSSSSQQSIISDGASPAGSGPTSSSQQESSSVSFSQSQHPSSSNIEPNTTTPVSSSGINSNGIAASQTSVSASVPAESESEQSVETIQILLRWSRHPELVIDPLANPLQAMLLKELERHIKVTVRANKSFREMMHWYCQLKRVDFSDMVFTFRGARLMPSSTPESLEFPPQAVIDVFMSDAYQFMKDQEARERSMKLAELDRQAEELASLQAPEQEQQNETQDGGEGEEVEEVGYLFIKLRGQDTADEKIRVKQSTTVQAILSHYKKIKKIGPEVPVKLEFDDEAMDPSISIGSTDVEDDDMLFVRVG
ncbi:hypothetical protein BGX28_007694 [Mortierella sp. GBA30]|nr:hypothetical protein BGX28_007694 [Mortierella sp. GBA30]